MIYFLLHVVNILIATKKITEIYTLKKLLRKKSDIKDMGALKKIMKIDISREDSVVHHSQKEVHQNDS